jgi:hypothetical protein
METIWGILAKKLVKNKYLGCFWLFKHSPIIITLYKYGGVFVGAKLFPFQFFNNLHVLVHEIWNNVYSNSLTQKFWSKQV